MSGELPEVYLKTVISLTEALIEMKLSERGATECYITKGYGPDSWGSIENFNYEWSPYKIVLKKFGPTILAAKYMSENGYKYEITIKKMEIQEEDKKRCNW